MDDPNKIKGYQIPEEESQIGNIITDDNVTNSNSDLGRSHADKLLELSENSNSMSKTMESPKDNEAQGDNVFSYQSSLKVHIHIYQLKK